MHAYRNRSIRWRKATRSYANNECVEVARIADAIAVRDSTLVGRVECEVLTAPPGQWAAIVDSIKGGALGH